MGNRFCNGCCFGPLVVGVVFKETLGADLDIKPLFVCNIERLT
jgi:hypothetical protein